MTKEIIENDHYKLSGVDIDAGNDLVEKIKKTLLLLIIKMSWAVLVDLPACISLMKVLKIQF